MNNPYNAPAADLSQQASTDEHYLPAFWSFSGRIGRVRYLAYTLGPSFLLMFISIMVLTVMLPGATSRQWLPLLVYVPGFILLAIMSARRLQDMNVTGWLALFSLIPLINFVFGLVLLCVPGERGENRFGAPPAKNTTGVLISAWVTPIILLVMIGIMAAVAIPAYQGYVNKAKNARQIVLPAPGGQ